MVHQLLTPARGGRGGRGRGGRERGFTLPELLIVIVIASVLAIAFSSMFIQAVKTYQFMDAEKDMLADTRYAEERVTRELGIGFRIVGFDTGVGLLEIRGYKDHPEIWSSGDFPMVDTDALIKAVNGRAELVFGDIENTVGPFVETVTPDAPIGFVSVDVDVYTGARSALRCLTGKPESCSPAVSMYFDDIGNFFANQWCGELAAIAEFNEEHALRKIDRDRSLPGSRPARDAKWYPHMYACHILDHEARNQPRPKDCFRKL